MTRAIALDIGSKRIGVAVSDLTRTIATSRGFIPRENFEKEMQALSALMEKHQSRELVVGLPLNMNGTDSAQTTSVRQYAKKIQERFPDADVRFWDERLSSKAGERMLIDSDVSRKKRKTIIDGIAAQWILQGYIDCKPSDRKP